MEASAAVSSLVAPLLPHLCAPNHLGALWSAVLAADAPPQTAAAAGPLAIVFCELINADGGGAGGAGGAGGDGGQALSGLAFASDAVPRLWGLAAARRAEWGGAEGGALLCIFCLAFSQARALPRTTHRPPPTAHRSPPTAHHHPPPTAGVGGARGRRAPPPAVWRAAAPPALRFAQGGRTLP